MYVCIHVRIYIYISIYVYIHTTIAQAPSAFQNKITTIRYLYRIVCVCMNVSMCITHRHLHIHTPCIHTPYMCTYTDTETVELYSKGVYIHDHFFPHIYIMHQSTNENVFAQKIGACSHKPIHIKYIYMHARSLYIFLSNTHKKQQQLLLRSSAKKGQQAHTRSCCAPQDRPRSVLSAPTCWWPSGAEHHILTFGQVFATIVHSGVIRSQDITTTCCGLGVRTSSSLVTTRFSKRWTRGMFLQKAEVVRARRVNICCFMW
jgi:hypothetical protein